MSRRKRNRGNNPSATTNTTTPRRGRNRKAARTRSSITLGIDIDTHSTHLLAVQADAGQHSLIETTVFDNDPTWFDEAGTITNPKAFGAELKTAIRALGVKPNNVHVNAADQPTLLRVLTLPTGVPDNELKAAVKNTVLNHLPVTEDEAEIRFTYDTNRIIAGTVQREHLAALMTALQHAGVKPTSIEPRGISVMRATTPPTANPDLLLVLNDSSATILARSKNGLLHNRISGIGATDLTADPESSSRALLSDMIELAAVITHDSQQDFTITLAGENSNHPTLNQMIGNQFSREPHQPEFQLPMGDTSPNFITSIGLALKDTTDFDFRPQQTRSTRATRASAAPASPRRTAITYTALALIVGAGLFLYQNNLKTQLETMRTEITHYQSVGLEYQDISYRYDLLLEREQRLQSTLVATERITGERVSFQGLIDRLVTRIPQPLDNTPQAHLTSLSITPPTTFGMRDNSNNSPTAQTHSAVLRGVSRNTDTIARIVENFEADPTIETLFDRATREGDTYSFILNLLTHTEPDQASVAAAQLARQEEQEQAAAEDPATEDNLPTTPIHEDHETPQPAPPADLETTPLITSEHQEQEPPSGTTPPAEEPTHQHTDEATPEPEPTPTPTPAPAPAPEPTQSEFIEDPQ